MTKHSGPDGELGRRVAALRRKARLTQVELAKRLGIARPYLAQIERGTVPSPDMAVRIAREADGGTVAEIDFGLLALDHHAPLIAGLVRQYVSYLASYVLPAQVPTGRPDGGAQPAYDAAYNILRGSALFEEARGLSPRVQWEVVFRAVGRTPSDLTRGEMQTRIWETLSELFLEHGAYVRHAG